MIASSQIKQGFGFWMRCEASGKERNEAYFFVRRRERRSPQRSSSPKAKAPENKKSPQVPSVPE